MALLSCVKRFALSPNLLLLVPEGEPKLMAAPAADPFGVADPWIPELAPAS